MATVYQVIQSLIQDHSFFHADSRGALRLQLQSVIIIHIFVVLKLFLRD